MYLGTVNLIVLFCAGLTLLMILSQVITSERTSDNFLFMAVLFCILALQVQYALAGSAPGARYPGIFAVHHAFWYLLGPLTYLHYRNVIFEGRSSLKRALLLLVPAALVLCVELAAMSGGGIRPAARHVFIAPAAERNAYLPIKIGGLVSLLLFFIEFFVFAFRTWPVREMPVIARYVIVTYIVPIISIGLILAAYLSGSESLERAGYAVFALHMAGWYIMGYRLPEVFLLFRHEYKKKYARSLIARLDADSLLERLRVLMETERLYLDDSLTMASLAGRMGVTAHQLSELLNARMGVSFKRYVNDMRIDEAKRILDADRGATALAVGMAVGFNSKSAFYTAFREITGMSPLEYRKRRELIH